MGSSEFMQRIVSCQADSAAYHGRSAIDHNQKPKFILVSTAEDRGWRYLRQSAPKSHISTVLVQAPKSPCYYLGVFLPFPDTTSLRKVTSAPPKLSMEDL